ncbi:DP-like transcription factor [Chloropicon primus]|uniref:DP-like transcription factor n=3 Tax=Chloropicon primus TaxID=1764295 RepID=A0A5B8MLV5_9CHLO|nr:DP-like transcription factor [Chloropicon primus]UPR00215.1 DP-like transcription factor [Chloropicon primus]|eukprot:QDZ21004.1 DP-like transcription factor [Chloropicon primus]
MSNPSTYDELAVGGASLQDDFLRDFMTAGVYDFASDIGIIQDGQIPSVKLHEQGFEGQPAGSSSGSKAAGGARAGGSNPSSSTAGGTGDGGSLGFSSQPGGRGQGSATASASQQVYYGHGMAMAGPGFPPHVGGAMRHEGRQGMPGQQQHQQVHPHGYLAPHSVGYQPLAQTAMRANSQSVLGVQATSQQHHAHQLGGQYVHQVGGQLQGHPGLAGIPAMHPHFAPQAGVGAAGMQGLGMAGMGPLAVGGKGAQAGGKKAGGSSKAEAARAKKDGKKVKKENGVGSSNTLLGDSALKKPSTESFQLKKKKRGSASNGVGGGKSGGGAPESGGKGGKGLRHFSMKVCAKVESKGRTTYNEVADELVQELSSGGGGDNGTGTPDVAYDEKNIRRRVYDALNVLMAMDIISKEKKEISWKGLPTTRENNFDLLKDDQKRLNMQIEKKELYLKELIDQKKAIEALIERNKGKPKSSSAKEGANPQFMGVQLPFLVVQTKPDADVDLQMSEDRQFVSFDFTYNPFEIHDENYVLHNMVKANKLKVKK